MLKDRKDIKGLIIEKLFEAKNSNNVISVEWSEAKLVSKSSEENYPTILVPLRINDGELSFGDIAFKLWGGTVFSYQMRYRNGIYFLEEFNFNNGDKEYLYSNEIPLKDFRKVLNINPSKYQKKMNDILLKELKDVWRGYSIKFEGSLSQKLVEDLVSAMARYNSIK